MFQVLKEVFAKKNKEKDRTRENNEIHELFSNLIPSTFSAPSFRRGSWMGQAIGLNVPNEQHLYIRNAFRPLDF